LSPDLSLRPAAEDRPTFRAIWDRMLDEVDRPRLSPATIEDYEDRASRLILPRIGSKSIADVSEADVDRIVASITGDRNRAYAVALIRKTINFAMRDRRLSADHRNPALGAKMKKKKSTIARALEVDEISRFGATLAKMEGESRISPWLANLFRLALICGLRPGEVRTLKWSAVNIPRGTMTVTGKTGAREIFLTDAAVDVLKATPRVQGCEYVFAGRRFGEPLKGLHKMLRLVQDEAKVGLRLAGAAGPRALHD
jgi:integrase